MATTSNRTISVAFSGDLVSSLAFAAAANAASPGSVTIHTLSAGANTITLPTGGSTVRGATIIPPSGNTQTLTLKGVTGDTGVPLHKTDPCSISFESGSTTFCLTAGGTVTGLRIVWS
tara:strand:- start:4 stop:357 length:354 start_codon:yes stop_codon:yes gene_type:complete